MTTRSMESLKVRAERAGSHWFSPGAMQFFNSRVCGATFVRLTDDAFLFVSSERKWDGVRAYSVRLMTFNREVRSDGRQVERCTMDTVAGEFQEHATRAAAIKALQAYAKEAGPRVCGLCQTLHDTWQEARRCENKHMESER